MSRPAFFASTLAALLLLAAPPTRAADETQTDAEAVSYHKMVKPIFQAKCVGCHQPAKAKGKYVMTTFDALLKGGSSGDPAVIAGDPEKSYLVELITPLDGMAEMPAKGEPLSAAEIDLIKRWIKQGAKDDTPANAKQRFDADNPPIYKRAPVITSMDYSPDGMYLAVAGFHEVLLMSADGSKLEARLIGMSQRIASVRFSPDGAKLAVTGGNPSRMGEVQVWDVAKRSLLVSKPVTYDTLAGVTWSPDGTKIAFGCADNSVRAIDAKTGEQIFFNLAHNDWSLDTVFSTDGKHLISVGRDMSTKYYEFATERFIDNVTSITPKALKGGILSVARHPKRNEIIIGGSDGQPKAYRIYRQTKRVIGDDANAIRWLEPMRGRVNSVDVSNDGALIAAGSSLDGSGQVFIYAYNFDGTTIPGDVKKVMSKTVQSRSAAEKALVEKYKAQGIKTLAKLEVGDSAIYSVTFSPDGKTVAAAGTDGLVRLIDTATGKVASTFSPAPGIKATTTVVKTDKEVNFIRDVNPILSRVGCNAGTCHGSQAGKNGFKLSLRGYDALFDVRAFTDDHASRRINLASPDNSLILLKATGAAPHEGGQLFKPDSEHYKIVRDWIAQGAKLDLMTPRVTKITITPTNPILQKPGNTQATRVVATYANGKTRDVTDLAFISSGNTEVASVDDAGVVKALRRGEGPILARYEGAYTATTLTVMGDREGFTWNQPETWGKIDELTAAKWQRLKIQPSALCDDAEFIRRAHLDLTGLPPSAEAVNAFMADKRPARVKRDELIDKLVGSDAYVEYWTNKWADLLQVNSKFLGGEGAKTFRDWIRGQVKANRPYDEFVHDILTASGSNKANPAASYYKVLREPGPIMENTTQLFLGLRFNCNQCHDHPFERWTQNQYFETAAYFARVGFKRAPESGKRNIGGTAVEGAKPLFEEVYEKPTGEVKHVVTQDDTAPDFPFAVEHDVPGDKASRRAKLAAWVTSPNNPYFARSYVNRLWGYHFGTGIIEPLDDIRAGNPPTNPQLLDYLTEQFINSGFDVQHIHKLICKSRTYQLSYRTNKWNEDDKLNYSHRVPKRLPAEAIYDAVYAVTGTPANIGGVSRAAMLPDSRIKAPGDLLTTLGRPPRESACECERKNDLHLGSVMAIISGPAIADAIAHPNNAIAKLAREVKGDRELVNAIYLRVINRPATDREIDVVLREMKAMDDDHATIAARRQQLEAKHAPSIQKAEAARQAAMTKAKTDLDAYQKQIADKRAKMEAARVARVKDLEAKVKARTSTEAKRLAEWEDSRGKPIAWRTLTMTSMKSTFNSKFAQDKDGSILVTGRNGKGQYILTSEVPLTGITGVRLEMLTDKRVPNNGPGRGNGNFVLTELTGTWASKAEPKKATPIKFSRAVADFSQGNYSVASAIDGKVAPTNNGWAIAPQQGKPHTALFELAADAGQATPAGSGTIITLKFDQQYQDGQHTLGRFRVSVTTSARPIDFDLPKPIKAILAVKPAERNDKHKAELLKYFRSIDGQTKALQQQLAAAKKPLAEDPGVTQRKKVLAEASKPVPLDPALVEWRRIAAVSEQQMQNKRLTIAQDLTWALINSPAFLFNH